MMLLEYKPWGASASHTIGDTITTYMYDVSMYNSASGRQELVASFKTLELALDKILGGEYVRATIIYMPGNRVLLFR